MTDEQQDQATVTVERLRECAVALEASSPVYAEVLEGAAGELEVALEALDITEGYRERAERAHAEAAEALREAQEQNAGLRKIICEQDDFRDMREMEVDALRSMSNKAEAERDRLAEDNRRLYVFRRAWERWLRANDGEPHAHSHAEMELAEDQARDALSTNSNEEPKT